MYEGIRQTDTTPVPRPNFSRPVPMSNLLRKTLMKSQRTGLCTSIINHFTNGNKASHASHCYNMAMAMLRRNSLTVRKWARVFTLNDSQMADSGSSRMVALAKTPVLLMRTVGWPCFSLILSAAALILSVLVTSAS